jgi:hypothetical protein
MCQTLGFVAFLARATRGGLASNNDNNYYYYINKCYAYFIVSSIRWIVHTSMRIRRTILSHGLSQRSHRRLGWFSSPCSGSSQARPSSWQLRSDEGSSTSARDHRCWLPLFLLSSSLTPEQRGRALLSVVVAEFFSAKSSCQIVNFLSRDFFLKPAIGES